MNESTSKTPVHLWFVAVIAVLWNSVGAMVARGVLKG